MKYFFIFYLGICAKFRLDAGQSYGSGGRLLKFIFDVEWDDPEDPAITANATANLNATKQYLKSLGLTKSRVRARDNSLIVVGPRYKFTLKVINFLGEESAEVSLVVQRQDKSLPQLRLGSKKKKMKTALGITLEGNIYDESNHQSQHSLLRIMGLQIRLGILKQKEKRNKTETYRTTT
jgi:hypothetical protein